MAHILDTAQINTKIGGIKQSAANLRKNVHEAGCAIVAHAMRHGTSPLATKLYVSMGGGNQKALAAWLEQHGPFAFDRGASEFSFSKKRAKDLRAQHGIPEGQGDDAREAIERMLDTLYQGPQWWEAKAKAVKADAPDEFKVEDEVREYLGKLTKRIKNLAGAADVIDGELVQYLNAALAKYVADRALIEAQRTARQAEPQTMQADVDVDTTIEA